MNTNKSGMSKSCELTDGELDAVSGGIIVVCRQQVSTLTQIGSAASGAGAGKVSFSELSITKVTDSASPAF